MPTGTLSHVRKIIKAEELINVLQDNVLDSEAEALSQNKVTAIKVLLAKCMPDLKAIEHYGEMNVKAEASIKLIRAKVVNGSTTT